MKANEFKEWDFLPLNLSADEIINPLSVICKFFDDDDLPGHLSRLKDWCYSLVSDDYFRDMKDSPAGLLYFHKLTLSLIEAAHLLKDKSVGYGIVVNDSDLSKEQKDWSYYPLDLSHEQQRNPYLVFNALFKVYNLAQYRAHLYEWLEHGLSRYATNGFIEHSDLLLITENLQCLFSACWFIYQRTTDKPRLKSPMDSSTMNEIIDTPTTCDRRPVNLYTLDQELDKSLELLIKDIVSITIHRIDSVQAMLYLGRSPNGKLFFLVFTSNEENRQAQSLASCIKDSCREIADVVGLVHHASVLFTGLENREMFFNSALSCPAVYLSGEILLPPPVSSFAQHDIEKVFRWGHWYNQGKNFLKGAEHHYRQGSYNVALFDLHQCAECILIALIRGILGYHINNHNLARLLIISQMFTDELSNIFNINDAESKLLFDDLKNAYVNVRYKDGYQTTGSNVGLLLSKVKKALTIAGRVYQQYISTNTL